MGILFRRCVSVLLVGISSWSFSSGIRPQSFSFDPASGVSNRFITPNGDGKNDTVEFNFSNPLGSDVVGKIFDVNGAVVASMNICPPPNNLTPATCLSWDGKGGGQVVSGGVYIYVIIAEGKAFTGSVVVIR